MPFLGQRVVDFGIGILTTEADTLYLCSAEPRDYHEASGLLALAVKRPILVSEPYGDEVREVEVSGFDDGDVTKSGEAVSWAIVDTATEDLLATGSLKSFISLTQGNLLMLDRFAIGVPLQ